MKATGQEIPCSRGESPAPGSPSLSRCLLKYYMNDGYVVRWVKVLFGIPKSRWGWSWIFKKGQGILREREIFRWKSTIKRKIAFSFQNVSNAGVNGHVSPERFRGSLEQKYEGTDEIGSRVSHIKKWHLIKLVLFATKSWGFSAGEGTCRLVPVREIS